MRLCTNKDQIVHLANHSIPSYGYFKNSACFPSLNPKNHTNAMHSPDAHLVLGLGVLGRLTSCWKWRQGDKKLPSPVAANTDLLPPLVLQKLLHKPGLRLSR